MPARNLDQQKRDLRVACMARRDGIAREIRREGALCIASMGIEFCGAAPGSIVSAYSALGSELDPLPLLERLHSQDMKTCLPIVQPRGNPLVFRAWAPGEPLVARTWGIQEPADTAVAVVPDVLLVPLLAFDRRGFRLGYGGGYYDRTLQMLREQKRTIAIGLAFEEQELAEVPRGPFDQVLDWVLRPAGPIKTESGG